jgi:hypothetical protein
MASDGDPEGDARVFAGLFPALYLRFHRRRDPRKLRLSSQTWAVLQHLAHSGPLTVGEAASHFDRSQSMVSAMVAFAGTKAREPAPPPARTRRKTTKARKTKERRS